MPQIPNTKYQIPENRDLVAIISGGLLLRLLLIPFTNINLDEGNMLFDAKFLWAGLVPYRDFMTRSLSYLLPLSLFAKSCDLLTAGAGFSLIIGRIFSALCITLTAYFIFRIGQDLFSRRAGLLASAFISFSPAFIYHSYTVNMHSANFAYVSVAVFLLLRALKKNDSRLLALSGLLLGLAVLARRSSLLLFAALGLYLFIRRSDLKSFAQKLSLLLLPGIAVVVPVYAALIHLTSWSFIVEHGAYGRVARSFFLPVLPHHLAVYNNFTVENSWMFLPLALLLFALFIPGKNTRRGRVFPALLLLGLSALAYAGSFTQPQGGYGARAYPQAYQLLHLLVLITLSTLGYVLSRRLTRVHHLSAMLLPFLWLSVLALTYLSYNHLHIYYLYECLPPLLLIFAGVLDQAIRKSGNKRLILAAVLAASLISCAGMYSFFDPAYGWKQSTLHKIKRELKTVAAVQEEVFTAGTIFALESGLTPAKRITHPYDYLGHPAPYHQWPGSPLPNIDKLLVYIKEKPVRLVIADQLSYGLISRYPALLDHIRSNYIVVADIDNVKIAVLSR